MVATSANPFDTLFRLQRELEARRDSDWLEDATSGVGAFPPINVFQQGHDFVAIVELPGVNKVEPNFNLTAWFSVLVVFVLAEVFREGARLRREAELTI